MFFMDQTKIHIDAVRAILDGNYPENPIVPVDAPFQNENGEIQNLILGNFTSSAIIWSKSKTIRANHYHKTDWHFSYLITGEIDYWWQEIRHGAEKKHITIQPGQMFFTPPMVAHAMVFPTASVFITFSRNMRDHESHESDVERVQLVNNSIFEK
jgi:dTDP-4-dehydrorhamnose 3,5-epimerase-like enzyme